MTRRSDYADALRDAALALALIPVAGLHTTAFWFKESLERTSNLADIVVTSITLARSAQPTGAARSTSRSDPTADVLARDLFGSARSFVRSMISLPGDSALYFTNEVERRLDGLRQRLVPDAATDLHGYVDNELNRLLAELDRLSVVARAEAGRPPRGPASRAIAQDHERLVGTVERLRADVRGVLDGLARKARRVRRPSRRDEGGPIQFEEARLKLESAFQQAASLVRPGHRVRDSTSVRTMKRRLTRLAKAALRPSLKRR